MLEIVKFIKQNKNWEELLAADPYFLKIKRKDNLIHFKYAPNSSPELEIVKEARGLILEDWTWNVVAYPFRRFYNYGEPYHDNIDWKSAVVSKKEDGSLIKVYNYDGIWRVGTSGCIDAEDAPVASEKYKNYRELFDVAAQNSGFDFDKLDPNYTYMFELISPYDPHVVEATETKLYHLGSRDIRDLKEIEINIGIEKPILYSYDSLDDCIESLEKDDTPLMEGYVVRDKNYNRLKIKGLNYLRAAKIFNNRIIDDEMTVKAIQNGDIEEFLSYAPPYFEEELKKKISLYNNFKFFIYTKIIIAKKLKTTGLTKKDFAEWVMAADKKYSSIYFLAYDNKIEDYDELYTYFQKKNNLKLIQMFKDFQTEEV